MSAEEFTYWKAYYSMFWFGPIADHWRTGAVCSTIANFQSMYRKRGKGAFQPDDFGMDLTPKQPSRPEDSLHFFKVLEAASKVRKNKCQNP